ncbi:MAG: CRISPR-associated endonuclease Cas3'' [Lewinella sp.]|nr:CRISPR-associated endonuclease Cas3'' [Lewinella sp.]
MQSLKILFETAMRVNQQLPGHEQYLAHLPGMDYQETTAAETLAEHADKVMEYAMRLSLVHELDAVVNRLIWGATERFTRGKEVAALLKEAFVGTIAFHDFGKINPHFQIDKMGNPLFRGKFPPLIQPRHGHSALGAYLYLCHFSEKVLQQAQLGEVEKTWLLAALIVLADSIIEHHSPRLGAPDQRLAKSVLTQEWTSWETFRQQYNIAISRLLPHLSVQLKLIYKQIRCENNFPLFALSRLNFSLLTSADNLATSDYMKQGTVEDYGLIDATLRERMLRNIRHTASYNKLAFQRAGDPTWQPPDTSERGPQNLNLLRGQMAIEVIREIRQIQQRSPEQRLFYLEAPTGGGKTNLSMLAAGELIRLCPEINKIFYVFPFTTLITQTHRSVAQTFGLSEHEIGLLHSKAGFRGREQSQADGTYGADWKNDLHLQFAHFPICLLTHIRFFDLLKSQRKSAIYPVHRLVDSMVIIDELQSYPPQQWDKILYFIDQYSKYFNMRFILMSATLPRIDKLNISRQRPPTFFDLLPDARRFFQNDNFRKRVHFRFELLEESAPTNTKKTIDLPELANCLLDRSREYAIQHCGRVFTMVEFIFKKSAADFRIEIEKADQAGFFDHVFVLSGTILEPRRREVINFLKRQVESKQKVLLITTQVVEAGVDIDMDIGFKNISLIDSDEQLAGRINRNVRKKTCDVYLFKVNEPGILYRRDLRFQIARNEISISEHRRILEEKDFTALYDQVLSAINKENALQEIDNFRTQYLPAISRLDFREIDQQFKLIDTDNLSVFVPTLLPVTIEGQHEHREEILFDEAELNFLAAAGAYQPSSQHVDGKAVWALYRQLLQAERTMEFFEKRISKKILQGILAKFTFSLFNSPDLIASLQPFCHESSLDTYLCLRDDFTEIYDYETGLLESKLQSADSRIF